MKHLLLPINFSQVAKNALPFAIHIAKATGASITLLTSGGSPLTEDNLSRLIGRDLPSLPFERKEAIEEELRKLVQPYQYERYAQSNTPLSFEFLVKDGVVMRDIVSQAKEKPYDLLLMGTRGAQMPAEEIWGTYTANMIQEVEPPMLIIPEDSSVEELSHIVYAAALQGDEASDLVQLKPYTEIFSADLTCLHITTRNDAEIEARMLNLEADYFFTPVNETRFELLHSSRVSDGLKSYLENQKHTLLAIHPKNRNFIESLFHASLSRNLALHCKNPTLILRDK